MKTISTAMSTKSAIFILFCCSCLLLNLVITAHEQDQPKSAPGTGAGAAAPPAYFDRIKAVASWVQTRFFPPGLNYATSKATDKMMTGVKEEDEEKGGGGGGRVKEAVAKSIEKGKETLEGTAKSAARMATQTAHDAKEKVKKTFSDMKTTEVQVSDYEEDDEL